VDVLALVQPGKPQGRKKTICARASGVGIGLPRSGRTVQNANASAAAAMTGGASSALTEFRLTGLTGAVAGILDRD
jgi:hypothetical protein